MKACSQVPRTRTRTGETEATARAARREEAKRVMLVDCIGVVGRSAPLFFFFVVGLAGPARSGARLTVLPTAYDFREGELTTLT